MIPFATAFLIVLATLYLPGFLIARAFSLSRTAALAAAPAFGIAPLVAIGAVLYEAGISCHALALLAVLFALSLVALAIAKGGSRLSGTDSARRSGGKRALLLEPESSRFVLKAFALYAAVGLIVSIFVFLSAIDGFDSFARKDDTTVHLSVVRAFLDSGTYSTLHSGSFVGQAGYDGAYYPSAWHIVVAIAASCIGDGVTIATNAATLAFTAVVLPLGLCLLLHTVFPRKRGVVLAGSLFSTTFAILPWGFLTKGQLLPNLASYALIPAVIALFIAAVETGKGSGRIPASLGVAWGVASIALCQPNGAFTCVIGMAAYAICRIFRSPDEECAHIDAKRVLRAAALIAGACLLWIALFFAPPLRSVVTYGQWDTLLSLPEALISGLSFMYVKWGGVQPALSVIVLFGAIATFKERRYLWLTVAYLATFAIYMCNMTLEGFPRQLFAGFWYSDYYRTAAMNALFAMPLAALGFAWIVRLFGSALSRIPKLAGYAATRTALAAAFLTIALAACQTMTFSFTVGDFKIENGLMTMRQQIRNLYTWDDIYTQEEHEFVKKASAIIEDGKMVVNVPNDGTAWSYGTDGIDVLFRRTGDNGSNPFPQTTNKIIRERLVDIASDPEVQQAVRDVDAGYVILLDDSSGDDPTITDQRYEASKWVGIESITSETPGFELLLSEGDMRLYKIESPAASN